MEDAALHCGVNEKARVVINSSGVSMAVIIGGPGVPELVLTASVCTPVRCLGCRILNIGCETAVSRACGKRLAIPYKFPRRQAHVRSPQHTLISAEGDTAPQCGGVHCTRVRYRRS